MPFTCDKCGWKDFRKVRRKRFCTKCDWKNAGNENWSKEDSMFTPKETDSHLISQQDSRDVVMKDLGAELYDQRGQRASQTSSFEAGGVEYALQQGMNLPGNKLNQTHHQFNDSALEGAAASVSPPLNLLMTVPQHLSKNCPYLSGLVDNFQKSKFPKNTHERTSEPITIPQRGQPFSTSFSHEDSFGLGHLFHSQPSFSDRQIDAKGETENQQPPIIAMETNSENTGVPLWSSTYETNDGGIWYLFPPSDQEQSVVDMETSSEY